MKTFAKFSVLLGLLLTAGFFGGGALLSDTFSIQRSQRISASPEEVYAFIGHLDRWPEWTAWNEQQIPDFEITVPGQKEGPGAIQEWRVRGREGTLEITSAEAARGVSYTLTLTGQPPSEGIITFVAAGPYTEVNWLIRGSFGSTGERWFGLLLDGRLGAQMEAGLGRLKRQFEDSTEPPEREE